MATEPSPYVKKAFAVAILSATIATPHRIGGLASVRACRREPRRILKTLSKAATNQVALAGICSFALLNNP